MMIINHIEIQGLKESVMNVAICNGIAALKAMCDLWLAQHFPLRVRPYAFPNAQQPEQHLSLHPCTQLWLSQNSAILAPRP